MAFTGVCIIFLISAQKRAVVLTSTHNLCFKQKYEKYQSFLSENFQFLKVKVSIYLNRRVFIMMRQYFILRDAARTYLSILQAYQQL